MDPEDKGGLCNSERPSQIGVPHLVAASLRLHGPPASEDWHTECVGTSSARAAPVARWHENLSKFELRVVCVPGKDNTIADVLSRWV